MGAPPIALEGLWLTPGLLAAPSEVLRYVLARNWPERSGHVHRVGRLMGSPSRQLQSAIQMKPKGGCGS